MSLLLALNGYLKTEWDWTRLCRRSSCWKRYRLALKQILTIYKQGNTFSVTSELDIIQNLLFQWPFSGNSVSPLLWNFQVYHSSRFVTAESRQRDDGARVQIRHYTWVPFLNWYSPEIGCWLQGGRHHGWLLQILLLVFPGRKINPKYKMMEHVWQTTINWHSILKH